MTDEGLIFIGVWGFLTVGFYTLGSGSITIAQSAVGTAVTMSFMAILHLLGV